MNTFRRIEQKYLISKEQHDALLTRLDDKIVKDEYFFNDMYTMYLDTPNNDLIIQAIEKPLYKEKFRLRSYGLCENNDSKIYLEIKKKFKGVGNKRRISLTLGEFYKYLERDIRPQNAKPSIMAEMDYNFERHHLQPQIMLNYARYSYYLRENRHLRITFDHNLRYRTKKLDLTNGDDMLPVLNRGIYIMEIKSLDSIPLNLAHLLSELQIYPRSFSKAKAAYIKSQERKLYV